MEWLISLAGQWLTLTWPIIIWTDEFYYDRVVALFAPKSANVRIYKRELDTFPPYRDARKIAALHNCYPVYNREDKKCSFGYYMLTHTKPYICEESAKLNPFGTDTFVYADFGITRFTNDIRAFETWNVGEKLKSLMIDPFLASDGDPDEYFHYIHNNVAATLLSGGKNNLIEFAKLFEIERQSMIEEGWCQMEEALYACVARKYPEKFDFYYGDFFAVVTNYQKSRKLILVPDITRKYLENKMYVEADKVIDSIDREYGDNKYAFAYCNILASHIKGTELDTALLGKDDDCMDDMRHRYTPYMLRSKPKPSTIMTTLYDVDRKNHVEGLFALAHQWLNVSFPIVIWTDSVYYDRLVSFFAPRAANVVIYKRELDTGDQKSIELYNTYRVDNRDLQRHTFKFHILMHSRPKMWAETARLNPFGTDTFIAMDFGITRHSQNITIVEKFVIGDKIKMMLIDPYLESDGKPYDYFHKTYSNVAGTLMSGNAENIIEFCDLYNRYHAKMIEQGCYQLDESIFGYMAKDNPEVFNFYYGYFGDILNNYEMTRNMGYARKIVQKFLDNGMYEDARSVLDSIDYFYNYNAKYWFVHYSIMTDYYLLCEHGLNPMAKKMILDTEDRYMVELRKKNAKNLSFYGL